MRAMDSLRKQFLSLLKDAGLVGDGADFCNMWSCDEYLIRSVICAGLYPGVCSVVVWLPSLLNDNTKFGLFFCCFRKEHLGVKF